MKYTFGYIKHNEEVNRIHLGASLKNLKGEFSIIATTDKCFPAENYNHILDVCETEYLILCHEDITFPDNLLEKIDETIKLVPDFGCLGIVGVDTDNKYYWSVEDRIFELDTLDCCFILINMKNLSNARFDTDLFGEYHLYVEDFCAQMNRINGKKIRS